MSKNKKIEDAAASEELSKEQVWDILKFSKALTQEFFYPTVLSPDLINSRMKDISFTPKELTSDALDTALKDPKNNEANLRSLMELMEIVSMPMKRVISYMVTQLAFDLTWTTSNISKPEEYSSGQYRRDLLEVEKFFDKFQHVSQFRTISKQLLRNEVFCFAVREGEKIVLQELPLQYVKITGRWDYGFLLSFDFSYFLQQGVKIDWYPPWFKKTFASLFSNGNKSPTYNPPVNPEARGLLSGQFAYWVDVPPDENIWLFKFDPSIVTAIPYFAALMPELIDQSVMRSLQKDANLSAASRIVLGTVPMLKDTKASIKDMIAIDADTLGRFLALVKSALSSAIKVAAAPLDDMKAVEFKAEPAIYDQYLRTSLAASGLNSALFFTSDLKANTIESQLSQQSDSLIMEMLYGQLDLFLEYQLSLRTKKYHFVPKLEGNNYYLDRARRKDAAKELAELGIVLPQKFSAAIGLLPHEMRRQMEEAKAMGFVDNLTPITPAFQMPKDGLEKPEEKGRPRKTDSELGEKGEETRQSDSNEESKTKNIK